MADAHSCKSSDVAKLLLHEMFQMPPLEVATEMNQNDRLRSSQLYPGSIQRNVWSLMQCPTTRDSKFLTDVQHFENPSYKPIF